MRHIMAFFVLLNVLVACKNQNTEQNIQTDNSQSSVKKIWNVVKTENSFIVFDDNSRINTKLFDMSYLCSLCDGAGEAFFVLSGRTCRDCDENIAIFIFTPTDTLKPVSELLKYTYPGKEYDYENSQLIYESKLFVGRNANSKSSADFLIWLQSEKSNSNKMDSSIFIVDVFNNKIREQRISSREQKYKEKLNLLKNCKEIKGIETISEP